mmetsp:Transcript_19086/g.34718  ORF Transcript_19086/g.34718 Transcript_19086/m.34718 type:complete len:108 (-) Transcript_19086:1202-1525(-)
MGCCESKGIESAELAMTYSSYKINEPVVSKSDEEFHDMSLNSMEDQIRRSFRKPINDIFVRAQAEPSVFTQRLNFLRKSRVLFDSTNNECLVLGEGTSTVDFHSKKW